MANKGCFKPRDLTGMRFGKLMAIKSTGKKDKTGTYIWIFRCDCGNIIERPTSYANDSKSCGCLRGGQFQPSDITGLRVGKVVAIEPTDKRTSGGYIIWKLRCDCGNIIERPTYAILRGTCKSCGCTRPHVGRKPIPENGAHINQLLGHYRRSAKDRDIAFEITKEQAKKLFESDCAYCGAPPKVRCTSKNLAGEYAWNGIDRADSSKGYTVDNCVPCCPQCNFAKIDRSLDEFKGWIYRAYHHLFPFSAY